MISDGWGINHIDMTEYFRGTPAIYKSFVNQYYMSTYPAMTAQIWHNTNITQYSTEYLSTQAWCNADYWKNNATGSSPASTAMYTGVKTAKYAIVWILTARNYLPTAKKVSKPENQLEWLLLCLCPTLLQPA